MLSAVPQVTLIQRLLFGSGRDHCYLELAVDVWRGHHSAAHSHGDTTFHHIWVSNPTTSHLMWHILWHSICISHINWSISSILSDIGSGPRTDLAKLQVSSGTNSHTEEFVEEDQMQCKKQKGFIDPALAPRAWRASRAPRAPRASRAPRAPWASRAPRARPAPRAPQAPRERNTRRQ